MPSDHTPLPQTARLTHKKRGWTRGFRGHRSDLTKDILDTAKSHETEITSLKKHNIDKSAENTHLLKHMLQMRIESGKHAKKLEGDHGYDVNPEKTVKHLEDIELHSTGRSVRIPLHQASNLSKQLLESTARLRKLRDTIARTAIEKEKELMFVRRKVHDAEKISMNRFIGVRGEDKVNKRIIKLKKKLQKIHNKCEEEDFMTSKYERMKWHLDQSLLHLRVNNRKGEEELSSVIKAETHARRKRLELYQSLAREKRNVDIIASKVSRIRNVQTIKLEEVDKCVEEQELKFHKEKIKVFSKLSGFALTVL